MQVAHLNGAPYEAGQHAPIALREGLTQAQLDALPRWQDSVEFGPELQAALALTDAMTRDVHVSPALMARVRAQFDERRTVELVGTIASYNMVSRFLEALKIDARRSAGARAMSASAREAAR